MRRFNKDDSHVFWMDKRHYRPSGTDLDIRPRERGISTVILTGVLNDSRTRTRQDSYNLGYHIEVVEPAVASLTPENHQFACTFSKIPLGQHWLMQSLMRLRAHK